MENIEYKINPYLITMHNNALGNYIVIHFENIFDFRIHSIFI